MELIFLASKEQPEKEKKERKRASKEKAIDIDLADDDDIEEIEVNQKLEFQVNIPKHSEAKNKKLKQPPKVSLEEQLLKQLTELRAQILKVTLLLIFPSQFHHYLFFFSVS